jgi:hypothetical protein
VPKYLNKFKAPEFIEETVVSDSGQVVGTIRVKPSTVLWKPKGAHQFHAVPLKTFADWITDPNTGASKVKK